MTDTDDPMLISLLLQNTEATLQLDVFPSFRRDAEVKVDGKVVKDLLLTPHKAGAKVADTIQVRPR